VQEICQLPVQPRIFVAPKCFVVCGNGIDFRRMRIATVRTSYLGTKLGRNSHDRVGGFAFACCSQTETHQIASSVTSYKPGTNPNVFCCPLLVQVSGSAGGGTRLAANRNCRKRYRRLTNADPSRKRAPFANVKVQDVRLAMPQYADTHRFPVPVFAEPA